MFHSMRLRDYIEGNWDFVIPTCSINYRNGCISVICPTFSEESDSNKSTDFVFLLVHSIIITVKFLEILQYFKKKMLENHSNIFSMIQSR